MENSRFSQRCLLGCDAVCLGWVLPDVSKYRSAFVFSIYNSLTSHELPTQRHSLTTLKNPHITTLNCVTFICETGRIFNVSPRVKF
jgi:hypothetical protein